MNVGSGGDQEPIMDINTTPLIDVMLVLLVMLIITIPIQLHSVNLNLPTGNPPPQLVKPEVLKIDIDCARRHLFQRGSDPGPRHRSREIQVLRGAGRPARACICARTRRRKYDVVAMVMASAQKLGLTKIGIVGSEQFIE
jgi:biopolymer transport protein ExbD